MKYFWLAVLLISMPIQAQHQQDKEQLKDIYHQALSNGQGYTWLNYLSNQIGARLPGSLQAEKAVNYTKSVLDSMGLDKVWLQPVTVQKWVRGLPEFAYLESSSGFTNNVPVRALVGSVATPLGGIKAKVVEVHGIEG
ncbi:MAG: peptidase M28 family protein, partial [Arenibacter sp.]|nr:peptidase M28 family protein [Arenibacter sp.]